MHEATPDCEKQETSHLAKTVVAMSGIADAGILLTLQESPYWAQLQCSLSGSFGGFFFCELLQLY